MRIIVRGIINGNTITLKEMGLEGRKIKTVCTILNEDAMLTKYDTQTGASYKVDIENANLSHLRTVFFEDFMHDFTILGDKFRFHAHSSDVGDAVDLLIETE